MVLRLVGLIEGIVHSAVEVGDGRFAGEAGVCLGHGLERVVHFRRTDERRQIALGGSQVLRILVHHVPVERHCPAELVVNEKKVSEPLLGEDGRRIELERLFQLGHRLAIFRLHREGASLERPRAACLGGPEDHQALVA